MYNPKMSERYYFDTSIWLDFFEKRDYNGEKAKELLEKIIKTNSVILYSELNIRELKHLGYSFDEVKNLFMPIRSITQRVHIHSEDIELAKKLNVKRKLPKGDALHALLARNNEAQLISRDKHFEKLRDIAIAKKPEDAI